MNPKQAAALAVFAPAAAVAERETGYPAEVAVATWAVETGLSLDGVTGAWNLFGITRAVCPDLPAELCQTHEELTPAQFKQLELDEQRSMTACVDIGGGRKRYSLSRWFTCFDSLDAAIRTYISVITAPGHRYFKAWQEYSTTRNVDRLIEGIAVAGYASGGGYAALLKQIAHEGPVTAALAKARSAREVR